MFCIQFLIVGIISIFNLMESRSNGFKIKKIPIKKLFEQTFLKRSINLISTTVERRNTKDKYNYLQQMHNCIEQLHNICVALKVVVLLID